MNSDNQPQFFKAKIKVGGLKLWGILAFRLKSDSGEGGGALFGGRAYHPTNIESDENYGLFGKGWLSKKKPAAWGRLDFLNFGQ